MSASSFFTRRLRGLVLASGLCLAAGLPAAAQGLDEGPVLVTADEMVYEQTAPSSLLTTSS